MKYSVWFVRLLFAAWMIPAGLNHFISIFPQPMGSQPLSTEFVTALIDSHLFDLVKAVELLAGICVLFGLYVPLTLVICIAVSFGVFYFDVPLEGWGSGAAPFGYAVLGSNIFLCLAYLKNYLPMLTLRTEAGSRKQLVLAGRIVFGAWMALIAANYLFLSLWSTPTGHEPLAVQLMTSLVNSSLLDVVMVIQLVAGVLVLAGILLPLSLCILMPISICTLYWAVLDQHPLTLIVTLAAFAVNGLLMLAYLKYYKGTLQRHALAYGEDSGQDMNFDAVYISTGGRTSRSGYVAAMITVLLVISFYAFVVAGRTSQFCLVVLLYPAFVLLVRRLRDMGVLVWLPVVPLVLMLATYLIQLGYFSLGDSIDGVLPWVAYAVSAVFVLWGGLGQGKQAIG